MQHAYAAPGREASYDVELFLHFGQWHGAGRARDADGVQRAGTVWRLIAGAALGLFVELLNTDT